MSLHDRLYLRFGLYHKRYGHHLAYMIEFIIVWVVGMAVVACLYGALWWVYAAYDSYVEAQQRVTKAEQQKVAAEQMLLACLNGRVVGRTTKGEYIGCQGATSFKM